MGYKMKGPSLYKKPVGPVAEKKKVKDDNVYVDKDKTIPLDPGYEDIEKIQTVQRLGLTPYSQKFGKNAKRKKDVK